MEWNAYQLHSYKYECLYSVHVVNEAKMGKKWKEILDSFKSTLIMKYWRAQVC